MSMISKICSHCHDEFAEDEDTDYTICWTCFNVTLSDEEEEEYFKLVD